MLPLRLLPSVDEIVKETMLTYIGRALFWTSFGIAVLVALYGVFSSSYSDSGLIGWPLVYSMAAALAICLFGRALQLFLSGE